MSEKIQRLHSLCQKWPDTEGKDKARTALIRAIVAALPDAEAETKTRENARPPAEQFPEFAAAIAQASAEKDPSAVLKFFQSAERPPQEYVSAGNTLDKVDEPRSKPLLRLHGEDDGDLLPIGEVGVLGGEGGGGKSTLASEIALAVALETPPILTPIVAAPSATGGVLWVSFEERLGAIAARARARGGINSPALERIRGVVLSGNPMFGPAETKGGAAFYNSRPKRLDGWDVIDNEIALMQDPLRLIVIDPALCAFAGEPNAVPAVREFISELKTQLAEKYGCAVLLIAHSTKEGKTSPFDRSQVGGSAAWTDGPRACLTLSHGGGGRDDDRDARTLAVLKANMGPQFMWTPLTPVRPKDTGWIVGFKMSSDRWLHREDWKESKKRRRSTAKPNDTRANRAGRARGEGSGRGGTDVTADIGGDDALLTTK